MEHRGAKAYQRFGGRVAISCQLLPIVSLLATAPAVAQDPVPGPRELHLTPFQCDAPCVDYEVGIELELDRTASAGLVTNSISSTFEPVVAIAPWEHVRFVGDFVLEPVLDETLGEDYAFDDLGAYVSELYTQLEFGRFNLQAGKIHIPFGEAWEVAPGLFADIPGEYELEERIGANAGYHFDLQGMDTALRASAFTTDRTELSGSLFTHRRRTRLDDGGAGNAPGLPSFALTLDGCSEAPALDCYGAGAWGYQVAALYQGAGREETDTYSEQTDPVDERGLAVSINRSLPLSEGTLTLFGELVYFDGFEGARDGTYFVTGSAQFDVDYWSYSLSYASRNASGALVHEAIELAAYYDLGERLGIPEAEWSVGFGYLLARDAEQSEYAQSVGVVLEVDVSASRP